MPTRSRAANGNAPISIHSRPRSAAEPARFRPTSSASACWDCQRTDAMTALSNRMTFSDEQASLLDVATSFWREKISIATVRRQISSESGFDRELWNEIAGLGWTGVMIPEDFGGSGLSLAEVVAIVEPMGRHLAATPFVSTQLFARALLAGGNETIKRAFLPQLCSGAIGTVALFEREGDWNLGHIEAPAAHEGDTVRLSGRKTLVCDAAVADFVLVSVNLSGAPALAVVKAADLPKERRERELIIDETRRCFSLRLDGISVPLTSLITGEQAQAALKAIRDAALLL